MTYNEKEIEAFLEKHLDPEIMKQLEELQRILDVIKLCEICDQVKPLPLEVEPDMVIKTDMSG